MKKIAKYVVIIIISLLILLNVAYIRVEATNVEKNEAIKDESKQQIDVLNEDEVKETIVNMVSTINSEGLNKSLLTEVTNLYEQISEQYSNEEIAQILKENKDTLEKNGVKGQNIETIEKVFNNISTEQTKKILETVDIEQVGKKLESGATVQEVLDEVTSNLSTKEKVNLVMNMVGSIKIIRRIIVIGIIIFIYRTLLRCVIYKKAGKKAWAAFIPIYRNVVMLKICEISPWWLLLLLVPVLGWIILWIISVASKFLLAEKFGKGVGFSFGLWLLPIIFESIIVFSKKTKYIIEVSE